MATTTQVENVTPIHDAILPYPHEGVTWAIVNLGDNTETENASVAELFEVVNRTLMTLSNLRDAFVVNPPSIECVKAHHNMYARLNKFIDARTKTDAETRLDFQHITPVRRAFRRYPVRYFDMKNRWTKRWVELYLYGLGNLAQLSEANTWTNDWTEASAKEMKKPFAEAYRLMCIELFDIPLESFKQLPGQPAQVFYLQEENFISYAPSKIIPTYEYLEHPYTAFFTEDRLRNVYTPTVPVAPGVTPTGGNTISAAEQLERASQQANPPIIS